MKWIRKYQLFKESQEAYQQAAIPKMVYKSTNLISEICVAMVLLNNDFLDKILDQGNTARYKENSDVFINDLKSLIDTKNNRLKLGKFINNRCEEDTDVSKINSVFDSINFQIDVDWNKLVGARTTARNIIDKILPDEKLTSDRISNIFWLGPNQSSDNKESLIVELTDGHQYGFFLNKNLSASKSASFNTFADEMIGLEIEKLHGPEYIQKWNALVQRWVKIIYESANKNIQIHIEKFIDPEMIDRIGWFQYFDLRHRDPRFKNLGELIPEFNENILYLSDLLKLVWKNRETCFKNVEEVYHQWMEIKISILNSKILEHLLTESLLKNNKDDIKKIDHRLFKNAEGRIKMKIIKILVEKLGCSERPTYYLGSNGSSFYQVPSRQFFRDFYEDISVRFDYHVKMLVDKESEENNDFKIKIKINIDKDELINFDVVVKFTGGDISEKLTAKYNFNFPENFNHLISTKEL